MYYFVKSPRWLQWLYSQGIWKIDTCEKIIYLTFDDGPHPEITPFVLDWLKKYNAKATFFCIGDNVRKFPEVYQQILKSQHAVGNHTMHHLNGWKTPDAIYLKDIQEAKNWIASGLFRPPYGRISRFQLSNLKKQAFRLQPIFWTVLSGDFDSSIDGETCTINVCRNTTAGSIVVFHDSEKAFDRLKVALPKMLAYFSEKGYRFEKLQEAML